MREVEPLLGQDLTSSVLKPNVETCGFVRHGVCTRADGGDSGHVVVESQPRSGDIFIGHGGQPRSGASRGVPTAPSV